MNYFTSDTHWLQRPLWKRRCFSSIEEHDDYHFEMYNKTTKRDIIFHLGDMMFHSKDPKEIQKYLDRLKKVPAEIRLIPGNHDSFELYNTDGIKIMPPLVNYKGLWLSHCPIHPGEFRERILNVHGHNHIYHLKDPRYFNVNVDLWGRFVTYDEIMERKAQVQKMDLEDPEYFKK